MKTINELRCMQFVLAITYTNSDIIKEIRYIRNIDIIFTNIIFSINKIIYLAQIFKYWLHFNKKKNHIMALGIH